MSNPLPATIGLYGEIVERITQFGKNSLVVFLFRKEPVHEITSVAKVTADRGCFADIDNRLVRAKSAGNLETLVFRVDRSICKEILQ